MAKRNKNHGKKQSQSYDSIFKEIVERQVQDILPVFLPGAVYEETLNTERIRPPQRVDKVFKIRYQGEECILHLEFQSGQDKNMETRLLVYNAILYQDYGLPVISMIIYLFRSKMAESPFHIKSGRQEIMTFHFLTLPLFTLDAERYVRDHVICMYSLLPTMQKVNNALIQQAIGELTELYKEDQVTLAQQIIWLELLLERTDTVSPLEKQKIQEGLKVYDRLWEESPKVQRMRVESKLEASRTMLVSVVRGRFPSLVELVQQQVSKIDDFGKLNLLAERIAAAPDESTARRLLAPEVA